MASSSASDLSFEQLSDCADDYVVDSIVIDALSEAYAHSHKTIEKCYSKNVKQENIDGYYDIIAPMSVPVIRITEDSRHANIDCCDSYAKIFKKSSECSENDRHYLRTSVSDQIVNINPHGLALTIPCKSASSISDLGVNDEYKIDSCYPDLCERNLFIPCSPDINLTDVEESENNLDEREEDRYSYVSSSLSGLSNVYAAPNYPDELCRKQALLGLLEYELSECLGGFSLDGSSISTTSVDVQESVISEDIPAPVKSNTDEYRTSDMETNETVHQNVLKQKDNEAILRFIKSKIKNVFEEVRSVLQLGEQVTKRAQVVDSWTMLQERRVMEADTEMEAIENYLREKENDWDKTRQEFKLEINYLASIVDELWRFVLKNDPIIKKKTIAAANAQAGIAWAIHHTPKKGRENKKLTDELLAQLLLHRHWKENRALIHEINRMSQITQMKLLIFSQQSHIRDLEQQHQGLDAFVTEIGRSISSVEDLIVQMTKRFPLLYNDKETDFSYLYHIMHCDRANYSPRKSHDMGL